MARKLMMCGNWKMNKSYSEAVVLAQQISYAVERKEDEVEIVLIPPACDLKGVSGVLVFDKSPMKLGAQNCHWEDFGAYTGEISPTMLVDLGCTWCVVGHSERRGMFGESDETVNLKVKALLKNGLKPIVCVGESLECREAGEAQEFVSAQVLAALKDVDPSAASEIVVAYEPIWAIGTGRTATPEAAGEMCECIHGVLGQIFGDAAQDIRVLYGGSMKPENADALLGQASIDGGLIGGASLEATSFTNLITACKNAARARAGR